MQTRRTNRHVPTTAGMEAARGRKRDPARALRHANSTRRASNLIVPNGLERRRQRGGVRRGRRAIVGHPQTPAGALALAQPARRQRHDLEAVRLHFPPAARHPRVSAIPVFKNVFRFSRSCQDCFKISKK